MGVDGWFLGTSTGNVRLHGSEQRHERLRDHQHAGPDLCVSGHDNDDNDDASAQSMHRRVQMVMERRLKRMAIALERLRAGWDHDDDNYHDHGGWDHDDNDRTADDRQLLMPIADLLRFNGRRMHVHKLHCRRVRAAARLHDNHNHDDDDASPVRKHVPVYVYAIWLGADE
jgi:hypothetical protein